MTTRHGGAAEPPMVRPLARQGALPPHLASAPDREGLALRPKIHNDGHGEGAYSLGLCGDRGACS